MLKTVSVCYAIVTTVRLMMIEYLTAKLSEDYDLEEEIIISQWVNTDRTEMVKQSISVEGFISLLSKSVENLIPNSYITKSVYNFQKTERRSAFEYSNRSNGFY